MKKIFDLHNDFPTRIASALKREEVYQEYGVDTETVVSVFWTTRIIDPLSYICEYIARYPAGDTRKYAIEDLWFVKTPADLEAVLKLPIVYAGLTWNGCNDLAGGAGNDRSLTDWGKTVVKALAKSAIAVDTAHLNERSFYAVSESTERIINSHSCLKRICGHERNLTDEQIKLVLSRGGIVGLTAVAQFMGKPEGEGTRADFLRQINAFADKFGVNGLCIGTDFNGTDPIEGLEHYKDFELLAQDLIKAGYSIQEVEKILYYNAQGFFQNQSNF